MDIVPAQLFLPASLVDAGDGNIPLEVLDNISYELGWRLDAVPEQVYPTLRAFGRTVMGNLDTLRSLYQQRLPRDVLTPIEEWTKTAVRELVNCLCDTIREVPGALLAIPAGGEVPLQADQEQHPPPFEPPPPPPPPPPPAPQPQQGQEAMLASLLMHANCLLQYLLERKQWIVGGAVAGSVVAGAAMVVAVGAPTAAAAVATPNAMGAGAVGGAGVVGAGTMGGPGTVGASVGGVGETGTLSVAKMGSTAAVFASTSVGPRSAMAFGAAAVAIPVMAVAIGSTVGLPVVAGVAAGAAVGGAAGLALKVAKDYFQGQRNVQQDRVPP